MQCQCFSHLQPTQWLETPQGVLVNSLGVGKIGIRCIFAPDHWQCHQEALKHCLVMPMGFLHFFAESQWQRGYLYPLCSSHTTSQHGNTTIPLMYSHWIWLFDYKYPTSIYLCILWWIFIESIQFDWDILKMFQNISCWNIGGIFVMK